DCHIRFRFVGGEKLWRLLANRDCRRAICSIGIDDAKIRSLTNAESARVPPEKHAVRSTLSQHAIDVAIKPALEIELRRTVGHLGIIPHAIANLGPDERLDF